MSAAARIACIEDDADFRDVLRDVIAPIPRFTLVGLWPSVAAARAEIATRAPAVLLVDVDLAGIPGHAAVPEFLALVPWLHVVMLTAYSDDELVLAALKSGAVGYLTKPISGKQLVTALDDVLAGGAALSPAIARRVIRWIAEGPISVPKAPLRDRQFAGLSEREIELLQLVADGAKDKEAAAQLGISHASVRKRLHAIYEKLQVRSRTEAALRFRRAQSAAEPPARGEGNI